MQLATKAIVVESMMLITRLKRRGNPLKLRPANPADNDKQVLEYRPKQFFSHPRIAMLVGIGKPVAAGSAGPPDTRQQPSMMNEPVTDIIKPNGMSEMGIEHTNDMTPGTETASFLIDTKLAGQPGHQMPRNKIAKLLEDAHFGFGWNCFMFRTYLKFVSGG